MLDESVIDLQVGGQLLRPHRSFDIYMGKTDGSAASTTVQKDAVSLMAEAGTPTAAEAQRLSCMSNRSLCSLQEPCLTQEFQWNVYQSDLMTWPCGLQREFWSTLRLAAVPMQLH